MDSWGSHILLYADRCAAHFLQEHPWPTNTLGRLHLGDGVGKDTYLSEGRGGLVNIHTDILTTGLPPRVIRCHCHRRRRRVWATCGRPPR